MSVSEGEHVSVKVYANAWVREAACAHHEKASDLCDVGEAGVQGSDNAAEIAVVTQAIGKLNAAIKDGCISQRFKVLRLRIR